MMEKFKNKANDEKERKNVLGMKKKTQQNKSAHKNIVVVVDTKLQ